ncbi:MAG: hypothetical protein RIR26_1549 [Pseudomonadota bacterium]
MARSLSILVLPLFFFVGCGLTAESAKPVSSGASASASKITAAGKSETTKSQVGTGDSSKATDPSAPTLGAVAQEEAAATNAKAASPAPGTILGGCRNGEAFGQASNCGGSKCDLGTAAAPTFNTPTCPSGSRYQGAVVKSGPFLPMMPAIAAGYSDRQGGADSPQTAATSCTYPWKQLQRCGYNAPKTGTSITCTDIPTAEAFKYVNDGFCIKE